jgi:hypothetical protein
MKVGILKEKVSGQSKVRAPIQYTEVKDYDPSSDTELKKL